MTGGVRRELSFHFISSHRPADAVRNTMPIGGAPAARPPD
jgi:hypothetical protein